MLFLDIDEYLFLKQYSNIHDYLSQPKFIKCKSIYINWVIHTDNDHIFYDNRTLIERFPKIVKDKNYCIGKSIIRGNIKKIHIASCHLLDLKLKRCDGFGKIFITKNFHCKNPDFVYNYIDHYIYKSTQEFIEKLNLRGDCIFVNNEKLKYEKILRYFKFNAINSDKINYIANQTGLNATYIRIKLLGNEKKIIV